ncbi:hypothetical protein HYH02_007570 [Chlamydomonas schloesseri]|uniref:HNH nuclease domain-containing protein n=1 Tax=Chlamydomonas schloesseri TaxID=2026947 RepID=A0A836B580_9CHLO|nr:hypothetical protein HYH02_007570 [Chlamydomonas schloesseri]|eukprot:KAG2447654.1 hypothetical protein HYH02_007570 [Chlamydomonas schloesseri]
MADCPWRPTTKNLARWERLQNSDGFLYSAQDRYGRLDCNYCGKGPLRIVSWDDRSGQSDPYKATVDHVHPLSRGGRDVPSNMVVSCTACNYAKADKLLR